MCALRAKSGKNLGKIRKQRTSLKNTAVHSMREEMEFAKLIRKRKISNIQAYNKQGLREHGTGEEIWDKQMQNTQGLREHKPEEYLGPTMQKLAVGRENVWPSETQVAT